MQSDGFQQLLTALCGSPEAVAISVNIKQFTQNMSEKFKDSGQLVM